MKGTVKGRGTIRVRMRPPYLGSDTVLRQGAVALCALLLASCVGSAGSAPGGFAGGVSTSSPVGPSPAATSPTNPSSGALKPPTGTGPLGAVPDPDWRLRNLAGEEIALGDTRGGPVLLNLWATWCPPCIQELASIDRLAERVADAGVRFLLVTPEDEGPVREFLARRPLGVPVYLEGTLAPEALGAIVLPTTFVLDSEGVIRLHHRGAAEWDTPEVEEFLRALSAEASW